MGLSNKRWILRKAEERKAKEISRKLNISLMSTKIILGRGIEDLDEIRNHLNANIKDLINPFKLKDMDIAVKRILRAVKENEKVVIFGDYDVDGVTSTYILVDFLRSIGLSVGYYLPDREIEGYGITKTAIDNMLEKFENKVNLIISVDCGITSINEVEYINSKGIDIVITDHHQCKEKLPSAVAVINPVRADCNYPFKSLAGVAIAFKLVNAICVEKGLNEEYLKYLDIVSIGTIADVAPIVGENRIIVKEGMQKILNTNNIGLKSLLEISQIMDKKMNTYVISFLIAPKINAAGRIGNANRAVELLLTDDKLKANKLAKELFEENKFRQEEELKIINQVIEIIEENDLIKKYKVLVLANNGWHHGIIGIVASKIVEKYYRPCFIFSIDNGKCKGSARSIEGFNIFEAISFCKEYTLKFGGHNQAAGLSIDINNLDKFTERINFYADSVLREDLLIEKVKADLELKKEYINIESVRELEKLEPFGFKNPTPSFIYSGIEVDSLRLIGGEKHLKMKLKDNDFLIDAVAFNMADKKKLIDGCSKIDLYGNLDINNWNNRENIQLIVKDIKEYDLGINSFEYFKSLNNIVENYESINIINKKFTKISEIDLLNYFESDDNDKILIFVNCLNCLKKIKSMLKWSVKSKDVDINYSFIESDDFKCNIIVNPNINLIVSHNFKYIFFYGCILDEVYFNDINSVINNRIEIISNDECKQLYKICKVSRNDVKFIYKILEKNVDKSGQLKIDNLVDFVKDIGTDFEINYFKFKSIISILEELNFLDLYDIKSYNSVSLRFRNKIVKNDLENSKLYKKLKF